MCVQVKSALSYLQACLHSLSVPHTLFSSQSLCFLVSFVFHERALTFENSSDSSAIFVQKVKPCFLNEDNPSICQHSDTYLFIFIFIKKVDALGTNAFAVTYWSKCIHSHTFTPAQYDHRRLPLAVE